MMGLLIWGRGGPGEEKWFRGLYRKRGQVYLDYLGWGACGTTTIQTMPKRSSTMPNAGEKKDRPMGTWILPPSASAEKYFWASASLAAERESETPSKRGFPPPRPSDIRTTESPILTVAWRTLFSEPGGRAPGWWASGLSLTRMRKVTCAPMA